MKVLFRVAVVLPITVMALVMFSICLAVEAIRGAMPRPDRKRRINERSRQVLLPLQLADGELEPTLAADELQLRTVH